MRIIGYFFALAFVLALNATGPVFAAETLDGKNAIALLIGKTWAGTNEQNDAFSFWHEQGTESGKFAAKFNSAAKGTSVHHGTWEIRDDRVCWYWPAWKATHCYNKFELDGKTLTMTRDDGQVHAGTLIEGNAEGL